MGRIGAQLIETFDIQQNIVVRVYNTNITSSALNPYSFLFLIFSNLITALVGVNKVSKQILNNSIS